MNQKERDSLISGSIRKRSIENVINFCKSGKDEEGRKITSINIALKLKIALREELKIAKNKPLEYEGIKINGKKNLLLNEIERLKSNTSREIIVDSNKFELNREKIEHAINRKLNVTDWKVLKILLEDPVITNKEIAEKVFMSVDGIGSSLRRMYEYFNIKESKYKKISLLLEGIKISNN